MLFALHAPFVCACLAPACAYVARACECHLCERTLQLPARALPVNARVIFLAFRRPVQCGVSPNPMYRVSSKG